MTAGSEAERGEVPRRRDAGERAAESPPTPPAPAPGNESIAKRAGEIAHDLGNLITIILGGADTLRGSDRCADPAAVRALAIDHIRDAGRRAAELVKHLQRLARTGSPARAGEEGAAAPVALTSPVEAKLGGKPPAAAPPTPPAVAASAAILLCEDDALVRSLLCETLRDAGHSVLEASHGTEAIERVGASAVDLLVCDVALPGIDGPALLERIRGSRPELPCLFISGYPRDAVERSIAKRGTARAVFAAADFLEKPFTPTELVAAVMKTLAARGQRRAGGGGSAKGGASAGAPNSPAGGSPPPGARAHQA